MPEHKGSLLVKIETLHGEMKALNEVVRMSLAEQKRVNEYFMKVLDKQEKKKEEQDKVIGDQDKEIRKVENKVYWFSGALAATFAIFEIVLKFIKGQ